MSDLFSKDDFYWFVNTFFLETESQLKSNIIWSMRLGEATLIQVTGEHLGP